MTDPAPAPRGRHAPPLEVRQDRQRRRLFRAASAVFARMGYADATAETIAREAGMSKATFYAHFDNKEDCIIGVFDDAAATVMNAMRGLTAAPLQAPAGERYRAAIHAFLGAMAAYPDETRTLLVEIIGAGPRARERRDGVLDAFTRFIDETNAADAAAGEVPRLPSQDDAFAIVGAAVELASRQLRTGRPERLEELGPVIERVISGLLSGAAARAAA